MDKITFSFGKNWAEYADTVDAQAIETAKRTLKEWLGQERIAQSKIIDIGSGSGLSSRSLIELGCQDLVAFDYDQASVATTRKLLNNCTAEKLDIFHGSILDANLVEKYQSAFDIVHSWGVLHHTGQMWQAIENASRLCAPNGYLFIALYQAGHKYKNHLKDKQAYNALDEEAKHKFIQQIIGGEHNTVDRKSVRNSRGMNEFHDLIDWFGGLPYEVAYPSEVLYFLGARGFKPLRILGQEQGGCSEYLFEHTGESLERILSGTFSWEHVSKSVSTTQTFMQRLSEDLNNAADEALHDCESTERQLRKTTDSVIGCVRRIGSLLLNRK